MFCHDIAKIVFWGAGGTTLDRGRSWHKSEIEVMLLMLWQSRPGIYKSPKKQRINIYQCGFGFPDLEAMHSDLGISISSSRS